MSRITPPNTRPGVRGEARAGDPTPDPAKARRRLLWIAVIPGCVITVIAGAALGYLLSAAESLTGAEIAVVLVLAAVCSIGVIGAAASAASGLNRAQRESVEALRSVVATEPQEFQRQLERWHRGDRRSPRQIEIAADGGDDIALLAHDIDGFRRVALDAATQSATFAPAAGGDQRVGVFVNLARRLQSLVHREIQLLDELEAQVEDPDLLKGLFSVDHLATRIRRHAENLAVLGGAVSRRQWSKPVNIYEVLRSAVAEVEHYSRVKLVRPIEGNLKGHAVADVIHLVAELVENATMFSAPNTQVLLRAQRVTAGLAVEVEDRGLGMPPDEQNRINQMLSAPDQIDIDELLQDGRIGLFVVSALARRHGIALELQTNIYGGTQAVLVLPPQVLGSDPQHIEASPKTRELQTVPHGAEKTEAPRPTEDTRTPEPAPQPEQARPIEAPQPVMAAATTSAPPAYSAAPSPASGYESTPSYESSRPPLVPATRSPETHGSPPSRPSPSYGGPLPSPQATSQLPVTTSAPTGSYQTGYTPPGGSTPTQTGGSYGDPTPIHGVPTRREPGTRPRPNTRDVPSRPAEPSMPRRQPGVTRPHSVPENTGPIMPAPPAPPPPVSFTPSAAPPPPPLMTPPAPVPAGNDSRPQLPKRRQQANLAPQLRDDPTRHSPNVEDSSTGHDPGLMIAFQRGAARADDGKDDNPGNAGS